MKPADEDELIVENKVAWRSWLEANEDTSDGVWLVLAKKGTTMPTSLVVGDPLEEALCSGWIDGQRKSRDEATFRNARLPSSTSTWSATPVADRHPLLGTCRGQLIILHPVL
ncbi:YdeI/OmpD-associated family protein [Timonella senegalensis]|uniref:YdeI/OmpD-associated family protein n=1 Tax=Timonella senegalensis TaxID=1465825 RepID=UPI0028A6ACEC|nr:hypothetical protein [Timonella senegalensis]